MKAFSFVSFWAGEPCLLLSFLVEDGNWVCIQVHYCRIEQSWRVVVLRHCLTRTSFRSAAGIDLASLGVSQYSPMRQ
jgi:hypothetical protein